MKKILFLLVLGVGVFASAFRDPEVGFVKKNQQQAHREIVAPQAYRFSSIKPLEREEAREMVKHYGKKDPKKDKGGFASLDPQDAAWLASQAGVVKIFFVQAAYLPSNADGEKRGRPVTLIVVERAAGARQFDYYESLNICPPPEGSCELEAL